MTTYHNTHWDNPQHSRYCLTLQKGWTWDAWMQGHITAYQEMAAAQHPVDFVVVIKHGLPVGDSISCLRFARQKPFNVQRVVYVNKTGPTLEHMVHAVGQVLRWPIPHFTASLAEARIYLDTPTSLIQNEL